MEMSFIDKKEKGKYWKLEGKLLNFECQRRRIRIKNGRDKSDKAEIMKSAHGLLERNGANAAHGNYLGYPGEKSKETC